MLRAALTEKENSLAQSEECAAALRRDAAALVAQFSRERETLEAAAMERGRRLEEVCSAARATCAVVEKLEVRNGPIF